MSWRIIKSTNTKYIEWLKMGLSIPQMNKKFDFSKRQNFSVDQKVVVLE